MGGRPDPPTSWPFQGRSLRSVNSQVPRGGRRSFGNFLSWSNGSWSGALSFSARAYQPEGLWKRTGHSAFSFSFHDDPWKCSFFDDGIGIVHLFSEIIIYKASVCQWIILTIQTLPFTLYDLCSTLYASQIKSEGGEGMSSTSSELEGILWKRKSKDLGKA